MSWLPSSVKLQGYFGQSGDLDVVTGILRAAIRQAREKLHQFANLKRHPPPETYSSIGSGTFGDADSPDLREKANRPRRLQAIPPSPAVPEASRRRIVAGSGTSVRSPTSDQTWKSYVNCPAVMLNRS